MEDSLGVSFKNALVLITNFPVVRDSARDTDNTERSQTGQHKSGCFLVDTRMYRWDNLVGFMDCEHGRAI
jgi:hypothetical protein